MRSGKSILDSMGVEENEYSFISICVFLIEYLDKMENYFW